MNSSWFSKDIRENMTNEELFIAGAKRQADHTSLPEDTVIWNDGFKTGREVGARDMKEQMMKDGDEGIVRKVGTIGYIAFTDEQQFNSRLEQFQDMDKVRIIIVKE